uniref:class I tRNA ligase family protein n=1 Tax=Mycolicibacterium poriferae TaxID=39694 RepID=UPI0024BB1580
LTGGEVSGYNIDPDQIENAIAWAERCGMGDRLHFTVGDHHDPLDYPSETFDGCFSFQAVWPFFKKGELDLHAREMYRVLKPGARYACSEYLLTPFFDWDDEEHVALHRLFLPTLAATQSMYPADVCAALERAGFRILVSAPSKSEAWPLCEQKRDLILWGRRLVRALEKVRVAPPWIEESLDLLQRGGQAWTEAERAKLADLNWRIVAEKRPYLHSVGHSERSGEPIEPRLSLQWWVKVESLAKAAGDAVRNGDTVIHPPSLEPRWFAWVDNMHDWCISRQLWWGHRIPIWHGPDGETVCVGPDETPPEGWEQDPDVLDTWFSSALWPFSTMGWPDRTPELAKFYPTTVLVTGYDILFFWVARMMMFGTFVADDPAITADGSRAPQVPFENVFLHGLIRDEHGRKMSKSRGNGIDPLDWVEMFGADALRFTLARGASPGGDLAIGEDHARASRNFATKLFNATRFALMNGAAPAPLPPADELTDADRWILGRMEEVRAEVDSAFDAYEFSRACEALYHFAWDEFCDWYVELSKVQLGEGIPHTTAVLASVLDTLLKLLHPVMPFVTEVLWTTLTAQGGEATAAAESLVVADWPAPSGFAVDQGSAQRVADMQKLITEVRRFRSDQGLGDRQKVPARLSDVSAAGLDSHVPAVTALAWLTPPGDDFAPSASVEVRLSGATVVVEVDTSGTVDVAAERRRLEKDLAAARKELAGTTGKLSNEGFLAKAPADVVDKIRARQQLAEEEVERITARLDALPTP